MSLIAILSYSYFKFSIEAIAIADSVIYCKCMNYELQHSILSRDDKVT